MKYLSIATDVTSRFLEFVLEYWISTTDWRPDQFQPNYWVRRIENIIFNLNWSYTILDFEYHDRQVHQFFRKILVDFSITFRKCINPSFKKILKIIRVNFFVILIRFRVMAYVVLVEYEWFVKSWNLEDNFRFNDEQIVSEISKLISKLKVISKVNQTGHSPTHRNPSESILTVFIHWFFYFHNEIPGNFWFLTR